MSDTPTPEITQEAAREMLAALRQYACNRSWHWNGRAWEWNGDDSADFKGDPRQKPYEYPSQRAVDRECGLLARAAIARATGGEARS